MLIDQQRFAWNEDFVPRRIVCLVPSITELLFELGAGDRVVGITKFCERPAHALSTKEKVGGTKNPNIPRIIALNPDLIITNKEENNKVEVENLAEEHNVYLSQISNLEEAIQLIEQLSIILHATARGLKLIAHIKRRFEILHQYTSQKKKRKVAYLIWKNPFMVAGEDTFISNMLSQCGLENYITQKRYPKVQLQDWQSDPPNVVLLSSEPYPFREKDCAELQALLPNSVIRLVDGQMFSWYGSRMQYAPEYFFSFLKTI